MCGSGRDGHEMSGILFNWSSSNTSILSVSGSEFTPRSAGNAVIIAENNTVSGTVNITVLPEPITPNLPEVEVEKQDDGSTTIDTAGKSGIEVKDDDKKIIISDANASVIIQYDDMTNTGGVVTGNISGITANYNPMDVVPDVGAADLAGVQLTVTITLENVITQLPTFIPAVNLTDKEKITAGTTVVGIMLQADSSQSFNQNVSSVTLTFTNISKAWVNSCGGTQNVKILHLAADGSIRYLSGEAWTLVNGQYQLTVTSPYGFSSYSLVGTTPIPDNGGADDGAELLASVGAGLTPTASATPSVKPTEPVTGTPTAAVTATATPTASATPTTPAVPTGTASPRPSATGAPVPLLGGILGLAAGGLLLSRRK